METTMVGHTRICPACGVLAAEPGDRYCAGCGSAADRSAWADQSTEPAHVLVNGQVWYRCSVCEERIVSSRSELDSSGRCDDCRP